VRKPLARTLGIFAGATSLVASLACVLSVSTATLSAAANAAAPGVTKNSILIGIPGDLSGAGASSNGDANAAIEARFEQINAQGGIHGRKIKWVAVDTQSTPLGAQTAAEDLVETQGVFAIAEDSIAIYGAANYLHKQGVPMTGTAGDGREWYQEPNTNLFATGGNSSPAVPDYTDGGFWKFVAGKGAKVSAVVANSPSAIAIIPEFKAELKAEGLSACDITIDPLATADVTTYTLALKSAGCKAVYCIQLLTTCIAVSTGLHQEGLNNVKVEFAAGPSQDVFQSSQDIAAAKGGIFPGTDWSAFPAGRAFLASLKKYDPSYKGGQPDIGTYGGWEAANLMVEGLEVAGPNPTRQSFIKNLRNVSSWSDSGLAQPVSFRHFGVAPKSGGCTRYLTFNGKSYVAFPADGREFCGTLLSS
jgi:branched-chain amino acid transport system substrate-binding protein